MKSIKNQINFERNALSKQDNMLIANLVDVDTKILRYPIHCALYKRFEDTYATYSNHVDLLGKLTELLNDQTSETIDDFIVENPSYSELTKICIAAIFIKKLYNSKDGGTFHVPLGLKSQNYLLKQLTERNLRQKSDKDEDIEERNWVHLLINIVRQGIRQKSVTSENKVKIISFNYDLILENILDNQFSNSENMEGKAWRDYIEILHPHGRCAPLPDEIDNTANLINEWADGIYVIQEDENKIPETIKQDRLRAKEIISTAREIYAAGFSFAGPNCRLLGIADSRAHSPYQSGGFDRKIYYCNWDGNIGLEMSTSRYSHSSEETTKPIFKGIPQTTKTSGSTKVIPQSGTIDRRLGVTDWIKMGVLGEMPG